MRRPLASSQGNVGDVVNVSYEWDFRFLLDFIPALMKGLWVTLYISIVSIAFGSALGIVLALTRKSRFRVFQAVAAVYINLFLALPVLVLMIWLYYCLPVLTPFRLSSPATAILALSLSLAGFVGDIVRGGMDSLPKGQLESALILGIPRGVAMRRIILPQAVRMMIPAILGQYITCMKLSSLASVIAVYELVHTATAINFQAYKPLETYTAIAVLYFLLVWPMVRIMRYFENKCLQKQYRLDAPGKILPKFFQWFQGA